ncbi:uncharacterized protein LOC126672613 [Mercurialis annua]|uniref:uncharacterized protein LOC126672613 n=1 Tax=Mercurialis annua TaxID=3986 RepID=UPI00215E3C15|nr:uncharacterized protein LOC126672613 [Mercurialis annua]
MYSLNYYMKNLRYRSEGRLHQLAPSAGKSFKISNEKEIFFNSNKFLIEGMTFNGLNIKNKQINTHHYPPEKKQKMQEPRILSAVTFDDDDFGRINHANNDVLVSAMIIEHWNMERILINKGSAINLMTKKAYESLRRVVVELKRNATPLTGFGGPPIRHMGTVILDVKLGKERKDEELPMRFSIVDIDLPYNAILGRQFLHDSAANKYKSSYNEDTYKNRNYHNQRKPSYRQTMLREIGAGIIRNNANRRNLEPRNRRKRKCPQRRDEKLELNEEKKKVGFIREVLYPEWVANVVIVKKANGKKWMCVNYTDLNKACPKDSYPLPDINQLVDSIIGHAIYSLAFTAQGYHQIPMKQEDQEKTSFITDGGTYFYTATPFGLKNGGATYQRLINFMFKDKIENESKYT